MNMKRIGLWAVGVGVLISLGLLTVESGYADEKEQEHATTCTGDAERAVSVRPNWNLVPPTGNSGVGGGSQGQGQTRSYSSRPMAMA